MAMPSDHPLRLDQILATPVSAAESLLGRAGFGPRAASTASAETLSYVDHLPVYEPPTDLFPPPPSQHAPRRLARLPGPGGRMALVHGAFLPPDTRAGRPGSSVTHVLLGDTIDALLALRTWASPEWLTTIPADLPRVLPVLNAMPRHGRVSDEDVLDFVRDGSGPPDPGELAALGTLLCPERLRPTPQRRREVLALTLVACLRSRLGTDPARVRFHLVAEPGLAALLLYGACRLVPQNWLGSLTFSTYEPAHSGFRRLPGVQAVATWFHTASRVLDIEYFTTRGIGFDSRHQDRMTADLRQGGYRAALALVDLLAAEGWGAIEEMHGALPREEPPALAEWDEMMSLAGPGRRLSARTATGADLRTLRETPAGQALLSRHAKAVVEIVLRDSPHDALLRQDYGDILRQRVSFLKESAIAAILTAPEEWSRRWNVLREVLAETPQVLVPHFLHILSKVRSSLAQAPWSLRLDILRAWRDLTPSNTEFPTDLSPLVQGLLPPEGVDMLAAGLPQTWVDAHLLATLSDPAFDPRLVGPVNQDVVALLTRLLSTVDSATADVLLRHLFAFGLADSELLEALLGAGAPISTDFFEDVLRSEFKGPQGHLWRMRWFSPDQRALLESVLGPEAPLLEDLWSHVLSSLGPGLLEGDPAQADLFEGLCASSPIPAGALTTLEEWGILRSAFADPGRVSLTEVGRVAEVCRARGIDPEPLLVAALARAVAEIPPDSDEALNLFQTWALFFPGGSAYDGELDAARHFLRHLQKLPSESEIPRYQLAFFQHAVAPYYRLKIAEDCLAEGLMHPSAQANLVRQPQPSARNAASDSLVETPAPGAIRVTPRGPIPAQELQDEPRPARPWLWILGGILFLLAVLLGALVL